MRECGLKHPTPQKLKQAYGVTPHAGVWIETLKKRFRHGGTQVTPHAGVWIETYPVSI